MKLFFLLAALFVIPTTILAAPVSTSDGLAADAQGTSLTRLTLDGADLPGVTVEAVVLDPHTNEPAEGFTVNAGWQAADGLLRLEGEVRAQGDEDRIADLVLRVRGVAIVTGTMAESPLLLPGKLLSKLPLVNLRVAGEDSLALAIPPDRLALHDFRVVDGGVDLRFPFGFTRDARPELQMRAPFTVALYRTDPRWHFRSALERYYAFFPELFEPFIREQGGWYFAAPVTEVPNPQHFHYWEGGPGGWDHAKARGMGTYPYRESSSATVSLSGSELPRSYEEAMERFEALADQLVPAGWEPMQSMEIVSDEKRSGEYSLLADSGDTGVWTGARQVITLDPPIQQPIMVRGFSKADNIAGSRDNNYSIYVDVSYDDGSYLFGQCATFNTGTHDWEESTHIIQPAKPVAEMRVHCLLRGKTGRAWFDDLHIGPADDPEVNWLENPGFEELRKRADLQYIRDNVCINSRGEYVFRITDNLSSDVGPATPMNLLRFTLNTDPDIPSTKEKPAVAATEFEHFDRIFDTFPEVAGCYIDSVSAWVYNVMNHRREHWPYNQAPFSYDRANMQVAAVGRFAMQNYLRALQERYHPHGKPIFTNIHVNLDAFPLYLVSDVPGIESSLYMDEDSMFFYRASSFQKPLVLLNFINLHNLDQREFSEAYHLNAAMWGEFPSTGRFVQDAYRYYGDVTHAYVPAIMELSAAGWQPVPLAEGMRVERFGDGAEVFFTLRGPMTGARETLHIHPDALANLAGEPVAFDTVQLCELPLERDGDGWTLSFTHGAGQLTIVRISTRDDVPQWLLRRARTHALYATRVQGEDGVTQELTALREALAETPAPGELTVAFTRWNAAIHAALDSVPNWEEDLFALSRRREVLQAAQALSALGVFTAGIHLGFTDSTLTVPGQWVEIEPQVPQELPEGFTVRLAALEAAPGRQVAPELEPINGTAAVDPQLRIQPTAPQTIAVRAAFDLQMPGGISATVHRLAHVFVLPAAEVEVNAAGVEGDKRRFEVRVTRREGVGEVILEAVAAPRAPVAPTQVRLPLDQHTALFEVSRLDDGQLRELEVVVRDTADNELARGVGPQFFDEPPLPETDLALARLGAVATTDSNYSGYTPAPLISGNIKVDHLHWAERAWASRDAREPHWLEIRLAEPAEVSQVWLYWSTEMGNMNASQNYTVIGLTDNGPVELAQVTDGPTAVSFTRHEFAPVRIVGVRVEQAEGGGPAHRPGIMWLREVSIVP